jgi:F-type H+-transporting ATPase subunit delta
MKESSLVKRYAKAVVLSADDEGEFKRISADLNAVLGLLVGDDKLKTGMATFLIPLPEKIKALEIIRAKMKLHDNSFRFLQTLAEENRFAFLGEIVRQLPDAWCDVHGVEKIVVSSAVELAAAQKERLLGNLQKALHKTVRLQFRTDPDLIAGISLQRGSLRYDYSLAGRLQELRESLVGER